MKPEEIDGIQNYRIGLLVTLQRIVKSYCFKPDSTGYIKKQVVKFESILISFDCVRVILDPLYCLYQPLELATFIGA